MSIYGFLVVSIHCLTIITRKLELLNLAIVLAEIKLQKQSNGLPSRVFVIFAVTAAIVPTIKLAEEFIVGDERGWTFGFDYQAWAQGKDFRVGDKLVFQYPAGAHNVFKVNGTGFQNCVVPPANEALTSGNDKIVLATPGRKWYICGVGKHCEVGGQKLFITVQPAESEAPAIAPSPIFQAMNYYSSGSRKTAYQLSILVVAVAIVTMVMF